MILASHAIIGAAVGRLFPSSPLYGFLAGLLSHYAMDAIPHLEYMLQSVFKRKESGVGRVKAREIIYAGVDLAIGILFAFAVFPKGLESPEILPLYLGILGGILPDALQLFHLFYKGEPLRTHQKFHNAVHARRHFRDQPLTGIPLQIAIVALFILISNFLVP